MSLTASPAKILVVDDTPSNLQVLFSYLELAGFTVLLAQNGERAWQILQTLTPDLILLDILMPDINGFELCRRLKSNQNFQDIPVIFLTALSETNHKVQGFEVGGIDYITKPIEQQEVIARIKTHLALKVAQRNLTSQNQELEKEVEQRQQVEQKLKQALDSEASIRKITARIRDSLDATQVLQAVTQELSDVLNLKRCQIEFYDSDSTVFPAIDSETNLVVTAQGNISYSTTRIVQEMGNFPQIYRQLAQLNSLQLVTAMTPEEAFVSKAITKPKHSQKPWLEKQSAQNCLICPIFDYQEPINIMGHIWLLRAPDTIFDIQEVRLVEQVASQCAIAIRQARLYQTSQIQIAELAKLNRLKDDFLKTISHELRSPMSSIQLAVQTLEKILLAESENAHSATFQRVLQIFRQASERQNQLIDDLLMLCYLDAQSETIITDWIELQTWIPEIVNNFQNQINNQKTESYSGN